MAVALEGIRIVREHGMVSLLAEVDGHWYLVLRTVTQHGSGEVIDTISAQGITRSIENQRCQRCKQPLTLATGWSEVVSGYRICAACRRPGEGGTP